MTRPTVTLRELRERTRPPAGASKRRRTNHLTQHEVADAAGIDRSAYVNLERGSRPLTQHYADLLEPVLGEGVRAIARARERQPSLQGRLAAIGAAADQQLANQEAMLTVLLDVQARVTSLEEQLREAAAPRRTAAQDRPKRNRA